MSPKIFSCLFMPHVLCSYVKSEKATGVMDRCMTCRYYEEFLRIMAEEDAKVMDEIDRMREYEPHE